MTAVANWHPSAANPHPGDAHQHPSVAHQHPSVANPHHRAANPHQSVAEVLDGRDVDLSEIAQQLDGHVRAAIDFGALDGLEQTLWGLIDRRQIDDDEGDLAKALLVEAMIRVIRDPASFYGMPPRGITKAEVRAVEFDEACPFCQMERDEAAVPMDDPVLDAEWLALHAEAAQAWRKQHAELLRHHGLGPPAVAAG